MSQSPSLSFGPAWMRPELTKNSSQDSTRVFPQIQQNGSKAVYTIDELLKVWSQVQDELKKEGFEEKYRQLNPIRQLVHQVEVDRQLQEQQQQQQQARTNQNYHHQNQNQHSARSLQNNDDPKVAIELTNQLNEINNWAKNENTGIDIAGIITNVTRSQSPFPEKPSLLSQDSFSNSVNSPLHHSGSQLNFNNSSSRSFSNHFQPQFQRQPELIPPALIKWYYLDPNGNTQGPFDGQSMQNWLSQSYLTPQLQIKRDNQPNFYTLSEFQKSVGNETEPFLVPLPDLNPLNTYQSFGNLALEQHTIPGLFSPNGQTSAGFINQPQPHSGFANNWASNTLGSQQLSGRSSPWIPQSNLSYAANDIIPTTDFRIGQSPFLNNTNIYQNQTANYNKHDDEIYDRLQSQVLNDVLKDVLVKEDIPAQTQTQAPVADSSAPVTAPAQQQPESQSKPEAQPQKQAQPQPQPTQEPKVETPQTSTQAKGDSKPKKEILKKQPQQQSNAAPAPAPTQAQAAASAPAPAQSQAPKAPAQAQQPTKIITKPEQKKVSSTPQLAPWANKTSTPTTPTLTLDQIQQLEAEESLKQAKLLQSKEKALAAQLLANAEKTLSKEEKVNVLPSGASWGTPGQTKAPTKTLLDIQREEAELEAAKAASLESLAKANAITAATTNGTPIINTALPTKNSFASIASTSATNNTNAWTTVTRKAITKQPTPTTTKINTTSSKITPDVLRSVSATTPTATLSTSGLSSSNKVSPRQEFLSWCRSTLKLNKGVNKDDVLQILLMLPTSGFESNEIIADTIYSNSSTMDGRRFAVEFLKRRKNVEDQVNDGLTWFDALNINPSDEDDGWDFQVVGKKNKKRN